MWCGRRNSRDNDRNDREEEEKYWKEWQEKREEEARRREWEEMRELERIDLRKEEEERRKSSTLNSMYIGTTISKPNVDSIINAVATILHSQMLEVIHFILLNF